MGCPVLEEVGLGVPEGMGDGRLQLSPAMSSVVLGLSILNWKFSSAFSNSKGYPEDYYLPTPGLTQGNTQLKKPFLSPGVAQAGRAPHLTGHLMLLLFGGFIFFLMSDHNLRVFYSHV